MNSATQPDPPLARGGVWFDLLVFGTFLVGLVLYDWEFEFLTLEETGWIAAALSTYAVARIATRPPYGPLSCGTVYVGMLCVFHFGLIIALAMGLQPTEHLEQATWYWLYRDETLRAVWLSLLGVAACAAGVSASALLGEQRAPAVAVSERADFALGQIGAFLTILAVGAWFVTLAREGGLGVFFSSYSAMIEASQGSRVPTMYLILHIGVPLMAATRFRWTHWWGWGAFAVFSLAASMMGVRGQVLFTMAAALPVFAMRGLRVNPGRVALGGLVLLAAITFIRDLRTVGVANADDAELSVNPLEGMMELGTSIRPVYEVVRWRDAGDEFILGASYWATIDRPLRRVVPWMERIPAEQDERIMNVLVELRHAGAIGFSPVAEAFRNFGAAGVIAIMGLTGFLVGRLDALPRQGAWPALVGVIMVPLLIQVRNSFVHVPFSIGVGVVVVMGTIAQFGQRSQEGRHDIPEEGQRQRPVA